MEWFNLGGFFPNAEYGVVFAFILIGAGLKFIDETFDSGIFNKKATYFLAPILVGIWIVMAAYEPAPATILYSILFAVLLADKVDNIIFKGSALVLLLFFAFTGALSYLWLPLAMLTILGLIDEKGNDYVDRLCRNKVLEIFFLHRFSMKLGVFALCVLSFFPWIYFIAFLAFDIAYDTVGMVGNWMVMIRESDAIGMEIKTSVFVCKSLPSGIGHLSFIKEKDVLGLEGMMFSGTVIV